MLIAGERILSNVGEVAKNAEVVAFLGMMLFAGVFWGFIEAFLFWHLDDLGASRALMGWTVAVGMVTSLPFLIFSGPITDTIGHMNVIILGMLACRYSQRRTRQHGFRQLCHTTSTRAKD